MTQLGKSLFMMLVLAITAHGFPAETTAIEAPTNLDVIPEVPQPVLPVAPEPVKESSPLGPPQQPSKVDEELLNVPSKPGQSKHGVATVTHRKGSDGSTVTITQYEGPLTNEQFAMIAAGVRQQATTSIPSGFGYQHPAYFGQGLPYLSQQYPPPSPHSHP